MMKIGSPSTRKSDRVKRALRMTSDTSLTQVYSSDGKTSQKARVGLLIHSQCHCKFKGIRVAH